MTYHHRLFNRFFAGLVFTATIFGMADFAYAAGVTMTAKYSGGDKNGQTVVGRIEPNSDVKLEAFFDGEPSSCGGPLGYKLFHTMAHAIGGNGSNLEYLARGEGEVDFNYTFNSNLYGQKNTYQAIFYCWSSDNPQIALGTAQQWKSPIFNQDTLGGACNFSNPKWGSSSTPVGEKAGMTVSGTTNGCKGVDFQFEIWGGTGGCRGLGNRVAGTVAASFPTSGSLPLSATGEWNVPDNKEYCFKIRLPGGVDNCAKAANGNCLWSRALKAGEGGSGGDEGDDEGTRSAILDFPNPLNAKDLRELIDAILRWIWWLSIPIAVIMIVYAGFIMMKSGGDPAKFKQGRKILLWAVIGLAVVFIGEGFIALIESVLDLGK